MSTKIGVLKTKLLTVLPTFPHPGLDPFTIEREVHKDGKVYEHKQYEAAVAQLLCEKLVVESKGLFRKKGDSSDGQESDGNIT